MIKVVPWGMYSTEKRKILYQYTAYRKKCSQVHLNKQHAGNPASGSYLTYNGFTTFLYLLLLKLCQIRQR